MGFLMPFIVLIERRLLRPVMLALLSTLVLVAGLGAQAGASGKPRKMAFPGWATDLMFPVLKRLKGLRGGPLDIFGYTAERQMERGLLAGFEADLDRLLAGLTTERLATAVKLAEVPQAIRGFGHVKDASVGPAQAEAARLWGVWETAGA